MMTNVEENEPCVEPSMSNIIEVPQSVIDHMTDTLELQYEGPF